MTMNNTNKPIQTTLKYKSLGKKLQEFGGWLTAHRSYLSGERSLASDTIWHLKLESMENTAIQQIICLYTFAQCWKTKPRQTK